MQSIFKGKGTAKVHRIKRKSLTGQIVIILLGLEILFFSSFTAFELPTATGRNLNLYIKQKLQLIVHQLPDHLKRKVYRNWPEIAKIEDSDVRYTLYVPQAAVAVLIGYALGWPLSTITTALFFLGGLLAPLINVHPFAAGGGVDYYLQPSFGYLIGMVLATAAVGLTMQDRRTTVRQLAAAVIGVMVIHLIGLAYLIGVCLFFSIFEDLHGIPQWSQWIFEQARNLSWYSLPYDLIFALALIGIGFPFRWLVNILVAPDIALRQQQPSEANLSAPGTLRS